jgi:L-glyceraldehyde 3-phosphate reductase
MDSLTYKNMLYNRCGASGLKLPAISLGFWHNFGAVDNQDNAEQTVLAAFDSGINHFDLANNYGPPPGSAESFLGNLLKTNLANHRDELIISSKAGYTMHEHPYNNGGSKKYLVSSLDQSLKRLNLDYVDIFYHHRYDAETAVEEVAEALAFIINSGRALYVGVSNYSAAQTIALNRELAKQGKRLIIHQPKYSMFERSYENELLKTLQNEGMGVIAFSPLAQGLLTDRYLNGIPKNSRIGRSRAGKSYQFLTNQSLNETKITKIGALNKLAGQRGQTLAQMALAWALKVGHLTSVIIGASSSKQLLDNCDTVNNLTFTTDELTNIEQILAV